jgi:glycine cleavage system aminomethyltransferase T
VTCRATEAPRLYDALHEAGLDFAIRWDKPFIGREALLRRRD